MSSAMKATLLILGLLTAVLILAQLVMGMAIHFKGADLRKAHMDSGYTAVVLSLAYLFLSMRVILGIPTRSK